MLQNLAKNCSFKFTPKRWLIALFPTLTGFFLPSQVKTWFHPEKTGFFKTIDKCTLHKEISTVEGGQKKSPIDGPTLQKTHSQIR